MGTETLALPQVGVAALIAPAAILVLCSAAGIGTAMMLPGRRDVSWGRIGGVLALAAILIFAALLRRAGQGRLEAMGPYFWVFSAIAMIAAVRVVTHPRPVYSALYFVLTALASAGLFVLLWAEFVAAALVLIYAGAIIVTYVFVIMLAQQAQTRQGQAPNALTDYDRVSRDPVVASALGFVITGTLLFLIFDKMTAPARQPQATHAYAYQAIDAEKHLRTGEIEAPTLNEAQTKVGELHLTVVKVEERAGGMQELAHYLFGKQLVNLELAGVILTVSMVGAIVIARRRVVGGEIVEEEPAEVLTGPGTPLSDDPRSVPVVGARDPRAKRYPEK